MLIGSLQRNETRADSTVPATPAPHDDRSAADLATAERAISACSHPRLQRGRARWRAAAAGTQLSPNRETGPRGSHPPDGARLGLQRPPGPSGRSAHLIQKATRRPSGLTDGSRPRSNEIIIALFFR
jgi:hypothetical protein